MADRLLPLALGVAFLGLSLVYWAINADWGALRHRVRAAVRRVLRRGGGRRGHR